jgi:RND family efflux transporter MFP subunit
VAPFSGTITRRGFDPGVLVAAEGAGQEPLFRIAQDETLKVVVSVPQAHLASVRPGQEVQVLAREFPGQKFNGRVTRTARAIDPVTRTLRTEIELPNPDRTLYAGMFVETEFTRGASSPLTVPASAVLTGPAGARVVVVGPDGQVRWQPIEIRRDLGGQIEVADGLQGDEVLVENPASSLTDGVRVEIVRNHAEQSTPPNQGKS